MTGRLRLLLPILLLTAAASAHAQQVRAYVEPTRVKPNQVTSFIIAVQDGQIQSFNNQLRLPLQIQQTSVASTSQQLSIVNGRQSSSVRLSWGVMPVEPGEFIIPSQEIVVNGQTVATNEVKLVVEQGGAPPTAGADDEFGPILQLEPQRKEVYQGEVVQLNCSLYVPRQTQLRRLGLIEIEKSDFAIARFPQQSDQTMTSINGMGYYVLTFRSTLSSLRTGELKVGPASMEVLVEVPATGGGRQNAFPPGFPQGFFNAMPTEPRKLTVKSQAVTLNVLPLPQENKPANFSGAVGDFTLSATATPTTLTVGDPVAVDLVVSGSGNFDALTEPQMQSTGGWKPYPAKRYSIEGNLDQNQTPTLERKIGFSQVFIPEAVHNELPSFEINYFSPTKKEYVTLRTEPIPLVMTPSPAAATTESAQGGTLGAITPLPAPITDPQPDITDILIQPRPQARWLAPTGLLWMSSPVFWTMQAAPIGVFAFAILFAWVRRRTEERQSGRRGELRKGWEPLQNAAALSDADFLHQAAQFIHTAQGIGQTQDPELKKILDRWQSSNFSATPAAPLAREERIAMLSRLSRLLSESLAKAAAIFILTLGTLTSQAADAASASADSPDTTYQKAIAELEAGNFSKAQYLAESLTKQEPPQLSAEVFELIGHARYRQKDPGRAALWYQRAQLIEGRSPELRQNLRHLHDQHRYLTFPQASTLAEWSLFLTLNEWLALASAGLWLVMLALTFRVLGKGRTATWPTALSIIGLILLLPTAALAAARPAGSARVAELSVVTASDIRAYTAATTTAGTVMELPPGSQVRTLEKRGAWFYVEFPSRPENLRGWVEARVITPLWPWDPALIP